MNDRVRIERLLVTVGAVLIGAPFVQAGPLRPVALTGTSGPLGPGLGQGVQFANFGMTGLEQAAPQLTGTGYISFTSTLTGPGVTSDNNEAHFANRGQGLELLARKGSQAAGCDPGVVYSGFVYEPAMSDSGKVAFQGIISGPDVSLYTNDCLWAESSSGGFDLAIREHVTVAPGTGGTLLGDQYNINWPTPTMWGNYSIFMSKNGTLLQRSSIHSNGDPQWGVFKHSDGVLSDYIIRGYTNPNTDPPVAFFGASQWYINEHGASCSLRIDSLVGYGIWTDTAVDASGHGAPGLGQLHAVAQSGQLAPGSVERWEQFQKWSQNRNGRVAFSAAFNGIPTSGGGVWSDGRFGVVQALALTGGVAPGAGSATFSSFGIGMVDDVLIADNNTTSFLGNLAQVAGVGGGNDQGIWSNRTTSGSNPVGNLRKVMREGDPVPVGLGPDYEGLNFLTPLNYWVNATGRVAFFGMLNDFTRALWIEQPNGSFLPVVKEFTTLDVYGDGSDVRLVSNLTVVAMSASSGDGRRTLYNDQGDIVIRIRFTDGSEGIFTTSPPPAPPCGSSDFNGDGDFGTDADIEAFFACLAGNCCSTCWQGGSDFNGDGDFGTDADIESFFRVLAGGPC